MDYNDYYFGFATRDDFMDWAVGQFLEHAGVVVTDKSAMIYDEETETDGCCEICYTVNVRVEVIYDGYYSYSGDSLMFSSDYVPVDVVIS